MTECDLTDRHAWVNHGRRAIVAQLLNAVRRVDTDKIVVSWSLGAVYSERERERERERMITKDVEWTRVKWPTMLKQLHAVATNKGKHGAGMGMAVFVTPV